MIATALAFVTGLLMVPWVIAAFITFALFAEYRESSGWSLFYLLVGATGLYLIFTPAWATVGYSALAYIPVGLGWSVFRYRRWVNKRVATFNENYPADKEYEEHLAPRLNDREYALRQLESDTKPSRNVDRMTYWTILFPISIVESLLDDVIAAIEYFITKTLRKVYDKMWESSLKNVESLPEKKEPDTELEHHSV